MNGDLEDSRNHSSATCQSELDNPVKTPEQLRKMIGDCAGAAFTDAETLRLILFDIIDTFDATICASGDESNQPAQFKE